MPYAFAHPAAVIPVARLLGGRAVPSALAIGSVVPDAWYLVPALTRGATHDVSGVLWFCLPVSLLAYAAFHLIFKQPLLALLPRKVAERLAAWSAPGLPAVSGFNVFISLLAGIFTHLAWDALTHEGALSSAATVLEAEVLAGFPLYRVLQHASTLGGTALLGVWLWRKLAATQPQSSLRALDPKLRLAVLAAMAIVPAAAFSAALPLFELGSFRSALRAGGVMAVCALGLVTLAFCVAWRRLAR